MLKYTIKLPPVTKKNHQQIRYNPLIKKPYIGNSPQYLQYEKEAGWFLKPAPKEPISKPVNVCCTFYMKDKRLTDLVNLLQAVDDLLVKYKVLSDDNYRVVASHDGSRCYLDRDNPRTEICITVLGDPDEAQDAGRVPAIRPQGENDSFTQPEKPQP